MDGRKRNLPPQRTVAAAADWAGRGARAGGTHRRATKGLTAVDHNRLGPQTPPIAPPGPWDLTPPRRLTAGSPLLGARRARRLAFCVRLPVLPASGILYKLLSKRRLGAAPRDWSQSPHPCGGEGSSLHIDNASRPRARLAAAVLPPRPTQARVLARLSLIQAQEGSQAPRAGRTGGPPVWWQTQVSLPFGQAEFGGIPYKFGRASNPIGWTCQHTAADRPHLTAVHWRLTVAGLFAHRNERPH